MTLTELHDQVLNAQFTPQALNETIKPYLQSVADYLQIEDPTTPQILDAYSDDLRDYLHNANDALERFHQDLVLLAYFYLLTQHCGLLRKSYAPLYLNLLDLYARNINTQHLST